jgi:hypothetical protein
MTKQRGLSQAQADLITRHNGSKESFEGPMITASPDIKARKGSMNVDHMYRTTSNVRPKDTSGNNEFLATLGMRAMGVPSNSVSPAPQLATVNVDNALLRDNIKHNQLNEVSNYIKQLDSRLSIPKFNKNDLNNTQQFVKKNVLRASVERSNSIENLSRSPRGKQLKTSLGGLAGFTS